MSTVRSAPLVVGLGGTCREGSTSEKALKLALTFAQRAGAEVLNISGRALELPIYSPGEQYRCERTTTLVEALRRADAVILSSPGYHGSMSGMMKNALDYAEDLRADIRPYLDGRAIGIIACAAGWQAAISALQALRSVAHALRGWPTPLGVSINSVGEVFRVDGAANDAAINQQLQILAQQVVEFTQMRASGAAHVLDSTGCARS
jgi:FMN reductase